MSLQMESSIKSIAGEIENTLLARSCKTAERQRKSEHSKSYQREKNIVSTRDDDDDGDDDDDDN